MLPVFSSWWEYTKNVPAAMATIPAANPSRPSMRFTALAMPTTQITVISGAMSGDRTSVVPTIGTRKNSMVMPAKYKMVPASTWPATFPGGLTSRRSSANPIATTTAAASTTPSGSELAWNTGRNCFSCEATTMAARKATNMAAPPVVAVGRVWTRRSSGRTRNENRLASRRAANVRA